MGVRGLGLEVRIWIWINVWINCRPITTQYFIAYNGITTPNIIGYNVRNG